MFKSGVDQQALIEQFANASAQQSQHLRQQVGEATLKALQSREMTLQNIRTVLKSVTEAASAGTARNAQAGVDPEVLLNTALAGMDDALLRAVEANRLALERFVEQGVGLQETQLQQAMTTLEKFEDTLFASVRKAATAADQPLAGPWGQVLERFRLAGSATGPQARATVDDMTRRAQEWVRSSREAGFKAAQTLAQSYTAMVSGVLIGMSDALRQSTTGSPPAKSPARARRDRGG